jgi:CheY-like chemotaxis protein/glycine cleavage system H lipoate-binding protein
MSQNINILVVDDEQIILDSVRKLLRKENYNVTGVLSVSDALEEIKNNKIHIILTDLMMPEIDGLEFMQMIKEDKPEIPIIMITGYATINTALQATQLGAFDYVAKPFSKKEILSVLRRAVDLITGEEGKEVSGVADDKKLTDTIKSIGGNSWMKHEQNGQLLLGVERTFLRPIGKIQSIYLPSVGDEMTKGGAYLQIFSIDMRTHTIMAPFSGVVTEVNQKVLDDPNSALLDPYGDGWLIKLTPTRFDAEK